MTLTEFLLARIAEDEAAVQKALGNPYCASAPLWGETYEAVADEPHSSRTDFHLAVDPARVLGECEAKRRIVERYLRANPDDTTADLVGGLEVALQLLALPYADHPDCRDEWKPSPAN